MTSDKGRRLLSPKGKKALQKREGGNAGEHWRPGGGNEEKEK